MAGFVWHHRNGDAWQRNAAGWEEAKVVLRSNISTITSTGLSLMPEGFEDFPPQDLADLVEYLKQD